MAVLRDAKTSQLILQGTPTEIVLAAQHLPEGTFLYDDVGDKFDPKAVLTAHKESLSRMPGAIEEVKALPDANPEHLRTMGDNHEQRLALDKSASALAQQALDAMKAAHEEQQYALDNPPPLDSLPDHDDQVVYVLPG